MPNYVGGQILKWIEEYDSRKALGLWNANTPEGTPNWSRCEDFINERAENGKVAIGRGTLKNICDGKTANPRPGTLMPICKAFERSIVELERTEAPSTRTDLDLLQDAVTTRSPELFWSKVFPGVPVPASDKDRSEARSYHELVERFLLAMGNAFEDRSLLFEFPTNRALSDQVREHFNLSDCKIDVVNVDWENDPAGFSLTVKAAFVVRHKMIELWKKRVPIGFGVGSGGTVRSFFRTLVQCLRVDRESLKELRQEDSAKQKPFDRAIKFFPLAASVNTLHATDDIPSIFIYEALAESKLMHLVESIRGTPLSHGEQEQFRWLKKHLHICVTSVADLDDDHSMLKSHTRNNARVQKMFKQRNAVGEVQFCPYSTEEFIFSDKMRDREGLPPTLMSPLDMIKLSDSPDKLVLLIAGKCLNKDCKQNKVRALTPLFSQQNLRVFNHAVIDSDTAEKMLKLK